MGPIVGIGELLWDIYPDGRKVAGGAPFNFAFHCHQLGHEAVIVSRVGNDELGKELREELWRVGMSDEYVQTDEEHPTGTVRIELDESMVPKYTIAENVAWDYLSCDERNEDLTLECRAVCFGSLVQRLGTPLVLQQFVSRRINKRHPELIIFDVNLRVPFINSFALRWGFDAADWRKINAEELKYLSAVWDVEGGEGSDDCFPLFVAPSQNGVIILTSGERGSVLFRQQEVEDDGGAEYYMKETTEEPAISAQVVDTVGAGDAFTAAMVVMHLEGRPLRECARFANHYAARVCEHRGATPKIDRREVELAAFGK